MCDSGRIEVHTEENRISCSKNCISPLEDCISVSLLLAAVSGQWPGRHAPVICHRQFLSRDLADFTKKIVFQTIRTYFFLNPVTKNTYLSTWADSSTDTNRQNTLLTMHGPAPPCYTPITLDLSQGRKPY